MEVITKNTQETQRLGEKLGRDLISGKIGIKVICLYGDLGSGKTTFIQGLAKGLGIEKRIISPTFVLMKIYQQEQTTMNKKQKFYHIDLYRLEKLEETKGLGLEEIFSDPQTLVAIEWAEKIKKILPKERIDIFFQNLNNNQRKIKILKMI